MKTVSKSGRKPISMEKNSEEFVCAIGLFLEPSSNTDIDITSRRDDNIDGFKPTF